MADTAADTLPSLSVIVLSWNSADYLEPCLRSLVAERADALELIVVDNGSSDGTAELVRRYAPTIRLIESPQNVGFCAGNNLGANHAAGDIVLFLNDDAELTRGCLHALRHAFAARPQTAALGCVVHDRDHPERVTEAGLGLDRFCFPTSWEHRAPEPFYASGCAVAVRRSAFTGVGGFDERYFAFVEDVDLCWRLRLVGLMVDVCRQARVLHRGGSSFGGGRESAGSPYRTSAYRIYLRERNSLATILKNYGPARLTALLPLHVALLLGEASLLVIIGRADFARQYVRALGWNAANLRGTLRRRRTVQRSRVVPDTALPFDRRLGKWIALRRVGVPRPTGARGTASPGAASLGGEGRAHG